MSDGTGATIGLHRRTALLHRLCAVRQIVRPFTHAAGPAIETVVDLTSHGQKNLVSIVVPGVTPRSGESSC